MDFELTKQQQMMKKLFAEFAEKEVKPLAADIDEEGHLIIELADGTRRVLSSGEVSVRPVSDTQKEQETKT